MSDGPTPHRVVIVDDDVWVRGGRAQALSGVDGIEVVATVSHAEALDRPELWDGVDVVLVDAWDPRAGFDRFPGVRVVEAIRSVGGPDVMVIVITGHVINDMLRLRMAEAGADFFYGHDDVSNLDQLLAVITCPDDERRPELDPDRLELLGVRPGSQPNAVLNRVSDQQWQAAFSGQSQKSLPLSRRAIMRIRRELGEVGRVAPSTGTSRQARWPEWQQIVRVVNLARGAGPPDDGDDATRRDD
jgi:CheY-like chemotaxis protein